MTAGSGPVFWSTRRSRHRRRAGQRRRAAADRRCGDHHRSPAPGHPAVGRPAREPAERGRETSPGPRQGSHVGGGQRLAIRFLRAARVRSGPRGATVRRAAGVLTRRSLHSARRCAARATYARRSVSATSACGMPAGHVSPRATSSAALSSTSASRSSSTARSGAPRSASRPRPSPARQRSTACLRADGRPGVGHDERGRQPHVDAQRDATQPVHHQGVRRVGDEQVTQQHGHRGDEQDAQGVVATDEDLDAQLHQDDQRGDEHRIRVCGQQQGTEQQPAAVPSPRWMLRCHVIRTWVACSTAAADTGAQYGWPSPSSQRARTGHTGARAAPVQASPAGGRRGDGRAGAAAAAPGPAGWLPPPHRPARRRPGPDHPPAPPAEGRPPEGHLPAMPLRPTRLAASPPCTYAAQCRLRPAAGPPARATSGSAGASTASVSSHLGADQVPQQRRPATADGAAAAHRSARRSAACATCQCPGRGAPPEAEHLRRRRSAAAVSAPLGPARVTQDAQHRHTGGGRGARGRPAAARTTTSSARVGTWVDAANTNRNIHAPGRADAGPVAAPLGRRRDRRARPRPTSHAQEQAAEHSRARPQRRTRPPTPASVRARNRYGPVVAVRAR